MLDTQTEQALQMARDSAAQQNQLARLEESFAQSLQKRLNRGAIDGAHPGIVSANRRQASTA